MLFSWFSCSNSSEVTEDQYRLWRLEMVRTQIELRGVKDAKVLNAMRRVPRHKFIPGKTGRETYSDHPLPIANGQTISQPYIVAFMTEQLRLKGNEKVLEIGTGSGYQAAILAEIVSEVYTIEIIDALAKSSEKTLKELGYDNIRVRSGDGYKGWPEHAPFDAVIVTAAPNHIPQPLIDQLRIGGRMIIPVGDIIQELILIEKTKEGVVKKNVLPVRFVPMTGEAQQQ